MDVNPQLPRADMSDMTRLRVRQIGATRGRCRCCGSPATLVVTEVCRARLAWQKAGSVLPASRSATCSVCVTTYRIGWTELTAEPATRRRDTAGEPDARDWAYPAADPPRGGLAGRMA